MIGGPYTEISYPDAVNFLCSNLKIETRAEIYAVKTFSLEKWNVQSIKI